MNTEAEIQSLRAQLTALEAKIKGGTTDRSKLPVNVVAYDLALDALVRGDGKALDAYCRMYRVPT